MLLKNIRVQRIYIYVYSVIYKIKIVSFLTIRAINLFYDKNVRLPQNIVPIHYLLRLAAINILFFGAVHYLELINK